MNNYSAEAVWALVVAVVAIAFASACLKGCEIQEITKQNTLSAQSTWAWSYTGPKDGMPDTVIIRRR
jgi:hypothetical protein